MPDIDEATTARAGVRTPRSLRLGSVRAVVAVGALLATLVPLVFVGGVAGAEQPTDERLGDAAAVADDPPATIDISPRRALRNLHEVRLRVTPGTPGLRVYVCAAPDAPARDCSPATVSRQGTAPDGTWRAVARVPNRAGMVDCRVARRCVVRAYALDGSVAAQRAVGFDPAAARAPVAAACPTETPDPVSRLGARELLPLVAAAQAPEFDGVDVSASVWIEGYGELDLRASEMGLVPASNQKLATAMGALSVLGAEHRFTTELARKGDNLFLIAGGDPTLTRTGPHSLEAIADAAKAAGVVSARRLVIDVSRYEMATTAPGWPSWTVPAYGGPLSAFMVDDNRYRTDPAFVAMPAFSNGEALADALADVGIEVDQVVVATAPARRETITQLRSAPMSELVATMLTWSDNQVADQLVREIGFVAVGEGSMVAGAAAIDQALEALCVARYGTTADGSGLSYGQWRSAREWQQLLRAASGQAWGPGLADALAVAGRTGTLRSRLTGSTTAGNVRAKTGTLFISRALSGYATTVDGRAVVFSVVVNGPPEEMNATVGAIDALVTAAVEVRDPA